MSNSGNVMLVLAVGSTLAAVMLYGVGAVYQQVGAKQVPEQTEFDILMLAQLLRQPYYAIGIVCGLIGWMLSLIALRSLPLFLVQSALAASVAVTAVYASYHYHTKLPVSDRLAIGGLVVGIAILTAAALPGPARSTDPDFITGLTIAPIGVILVASVILGSIKKSQGARALAAVAGVCFSGAALGARAITLPDRAVLLFANPLAWAVLAYTLVGAITFAVSLQRGSAANTAAVSHAGEISIPTILGITFLGEGVRPGFWPAIIIGCVVIIASVRQLSA
jgi:drug/metabolite transporter (DMT)-like permease